MTDLLRRLSEPFPADVVEWRVGSTNREKTKAMALAYVDARAVQDRLDEVCGTDWACEHVIANAGSKMTCRIGLKVGEDWVWRSNGAGETDVEADKGSYSDSFKRAAVMWRIGRYLYDLPSPWVEITPMGKSFKIADHEHAKLRSLLQRQGAKPTASVTAIPQGSSKAQPDPEIQRLIMIGDEASDRGTDALRAFWGGLSKDRKRDVGGEAQLDKWKIKAKQIDEADQAMQGAA